ncbi:hypothetical protein WCU81_13595 [Pectobacterium atrosepticum]|uniref:hypothetical protein n=1 Tax=Pectobacterium atrosepticum TaxID=29471 RepID=UPI0008FC134C|nr:hypothetical protein [Pectobacterium atrosepticum]ATY92299.1 hypothetical protein CVS35_19075 [Pectobacterium atrosepticum]MBL0894392.1 hypothetical protein [Pectobacterium atrosepticum]MCA6978322.1 hypothetical protein [Pectobacterium atrosepticum]MCL6391700.1 hypothetical protein [Pectobacterium atrosepticum]MDK9443889.1 hypothetical protein [Pectobacterium atrosepticum]
MKKHPNKHIQEAIEYALTRGWRFYSSNGHAFGRLICSTPDHSTHIMSIWSTPSVSENHAKQIRRNVDSCLAMQKQ